ncbi:MAG: hypothetical protein GY729_17905 [Desulfobacteraceae bacterium]|nr:hypothetical protein [Desulfobacteraceae bacterium]
MPSEISTSFDLPFEEQLAFFNKKKVVLSPDSWKDVWDKAHAKAFTVARVTSTDVLQEIQNNLKDAMEKGTTLKQFKDDLVPYLENRGWYAPEGEKAVDLSGRKRLAGHRLTTIYRTNLASSYNTGRFKQQMDNRARRPFLQYHITPRPTNRPEHKAMDKFVAKVGSAVWDKWYPPNGFRCGCYVTALTAAQVKARGLDVSTKAPKIEPDDGSTPEEVKPDEGFDYHVGKAGLNVIQPNYRKYDKKLRDQLKGDLASLKGKLAAGAATKTAAKFEPQKTVKAAEKWAIDNDLADVVDYGDLEVDFVNAINEKLFELKKDFPDTRQGLKFVGDMQKRGDTPIDQSAAGASRRTGKYAGISFNPNYFKEQYIKKTREIWKTSEETGYFAKGTSDILSTIDHEIGHIIDFTTQNSLSAINKIDAFYKKTGKEKLQSDLSYYGSTDPEEMIAEAYAEFKYNPKPRKLCLQIMNLIGII